MSFISRAPPTPVLRDLLSMAKRVTFYGFLVALARSEALNTAIGKLEYTALDISHCLKAWGKYNG